MRRLPLAIATLFALVGSAAAGDYADRAIIGFSADGAYFAFEEYGVQDGSGFPYSTIYVIQTATDSWVSGTPFSVILQNEQATLESARQQALSQALQLLTQFGISHPGRGLVVNPITEITGNGHDAEFLLRPLVPLPTSGAKLALFETTLPAPDCPDFGNSYKGFDLTLTTPEGAVRTLQHDTRIPQTRRCPLGYGISDVIAFDAGDRDLVLIVLINVFSLGFEGPDRRFIAIATDITN